METTSRLSANSKKKILQHQLLSWKTHSCPSVHHRPEQRISNAQSQVSPIISRATRNVGLTLYEILGVVELMRVAYEKGELASVEARLSLLIGEALDMVTAVSNIIKLTMLETEPPAVACNRFDVIALLHEVSQAARSLVGNKPITVMDVSSPDPIVIYSDQILLRQIAFELISNAAKFTDRGRVALIVCKDDTSLSLTIADTGRGMTQELLAALFESPNRNYDSEVNGFETSGLGLRIVKKMVCLLGGSMTASSKYGEGTIVEISLPIAVQLKTSPGIS